MKNKFGNIANFFITQGATNPFAFAQMGNAKWYNNGPRNKSGDTDIG